MAQAKESQYIPGMLRLSTGNIGILLLLLSLVVALTGCQPSENKPKSDQTISDTLSDSLAGRENSSPKYQDSVTIALTGRAELSVLALLEESHAVKKTASAMGIFVNGIDSIMNDSETFWMYSVNDSMGQVASDTYITQPGDRVVWHFRRFLK